MPEPGNPQGESPPAAVDPALKAAQDELARKKLAAHAEQEKLLAQAQKAIRDAALPRRRPRRRSKARSPPTTRSRFRARF